MALRVAITNLKGGVGKTTLSLMLAMYVDGVLGKPVLLVDMDPQAGTSSLMLGGEISGVTGSDALLDYLDGGPADQYFPAAVRKAPIGDRLFVMPSDKRLSELVTQGAPQDLLANLLDDNALPDDMLVIVDTGTTPHLVGMSINAADRVLIPLMMSRQTMKPTATALSMVVRGRRELTGLVPVGAGQAGWEQELLVSWQQRLAAMEPFKGSKVFSPLPHSKAIVRGGWLDSGIPAKFVPVIADICRALEFDVPEEPAPEPVSVAVGVDEKAVADG